MPSRLEHITLAERMEPGRRWLQGSRGLIADLAATSGTSRRLLYRLRARPNAGCPWGSASYGAGVETPRP